MRFALRSVLVLSVLYGLVFALGDAYFARGGAPLWWAAVFVVGLIGVQYLLAPAIIEWIFPIGYYDEDFSPATRGFVAQVCAERGMPVPKLGTIQSGTPNAFAFGRLQRDARVVVTRGLMDSLSEEELHAVLAHELGHIAHYDFAVMAVASLAPLLLWQIYAWTSRINGHGKAVSYGAYLAYWFGQFLVLLLNRTREYGADAFSAERTGQPALLASALMKVCYGTLQETSEAARLQKQGTPQQKKDARKSKQLGTAIGLMGIMGAASSQAMALGMEGPEAAARVMRWDLVSPWARVYELNATHPLTAFRIRALNRLAAARGQAVEHPLPENTPLRWTGFPLELLFWGLPLLCGFLLVSWLWLGSAHFWRRGHAYLHVLPWLVLVLGVSWAGRIAFRYHGKFQRRQARELLEDLAVNEMRPRAVEVTGEVIGHGIPGAVWSPDLLLRDETGLMFLLYRSTVPLGRLFFALRSADRVIGEQVTVRGWYRRGLRPYVEIAEIEARVPKARARTGLNTLFNGGDGSEPAEYEELRERSYSRWIQMVLSAAVTVVGIVWLLGS